MKNRYYTFCFCLLASSFVYSQTNDKANVKNSVKYKNQVSKNQSSSYTDNVSQANNSNFVTSTDSIHPAINFSTEALVPTYSSSVTIEEAKPKNEK